MPIRPFSACSVPGCPNRVAHGGRCPVHVARQHRPSAASRGYDSTWRTTRAAHLADNPWCADCLALGAYVKATDVHHVIAKRFGGTDDGYNLMSLCHRHHSARTRGESAANSVDRCALS